MPDIAALGNTLFTVWLDNRNSIYKDIYFAKSSDGGATWSANTRINDPIMRIWRKNPVLAVQPDGTIWIAWFTFEEGDLFTPHENTLRIAMSTDGGETFQLTTLIEDEARVVKQPQLTVDQHDGRIYLLHSEYHDQGDDSGWDIKLLAYDAQGQSWTETRINDVQFAGHGADDAEDAGPSMSLTARNGTVCAAWEDTRERFRIYGSCSTDSGRTFGANFAISRVGAIFPQIALSVDGTLYATYKRQGDFDHKIFLRRSADHGVNWSDPQKQATDADSWDLAVDANGQLVFTWIRCVANNVESCNLYLSTSIDRGRSFATLHVEDSDDTKLQEHVSLATSGSGTETRAYLAWSDNRNARFAGRRIWSARADLDGIPPTAPTNLSATPHDGAISLTWEASTDAMGIQGYHIYRSTSSGGSYTRINPMMVLDTRYSDVELDGRTYFYKVSAVDGTGNRGPLSNETSAAAHSGTDLPRNGTIAYQVGDDIRLRDLSDIAMERTLARGSMPHFSSDGSRVYYKTPDGISSQLVSGGDTRIFFPHQQVHHYNLHPDGKHLAAMLNRPFGGNLCVNAEPHYIAAPNQTLFMHRDTIGTDLALSADGRWLVYRQEGFCQGIVTVDIEPANFCIIDLTQSKQICLGGAGYHEPDFAPNANELVFAANPTGQYEIWKARIEDDGGLSNVTQLTRGPAGVHSRGPAWSSDGKSIVFQRDVDPDQGQDWRLFTVRADGAALRNLNVPGTVPVWTDSRSDNPSNHRPNAENQSITTAEDTTVNIELNATDADQNPLTYDVVNGPMHGTLNGTPPNLTYTSNANFHGSDRFTFKVNDGHVDSDTATVTITVTPVNDRPVANDLTLSTTEGTPIAIALTGSDVDSDELAFSIINDPTHGQLSGAAPKLTYTPDAGYTGQDEFQLKVNDGQLDSNVATVTITVKPMGSANSTIYLPVVFKD